MGEFKNKHSRPGSKL